MAFRLAAFVAASILCFSVRCTGGQSNETEKIYLVTLLPYPNASPLFSPSFSEGINIIPALDLAVQHVNQREGFLDGYELELIHRDGGCEVPTTTFYGLVSGLFVDDHKAVGLIGPGCSASTIAALSTIHTQNRTSYIAVHGAGSPNIDKTSFPNSFGTLGSSAAFVDVLFAIMSETSWREIAVLVGPNRPFYIDLAAIFQSNLPDAFPDAEIVFSIVVHDFFIPLDQLRESFARVTFVFASVDLVQRIMCLALQSGMTYPNFQWVFVGHTFDDFTDEGIAFVYNGQGYNCSTEELFGAALNGSFLLNYKLSPFEEDEPTDSGLTYREYLQQYNASVMAYNSNLENSNYPAEISIWATYFYDAVWAWAVVLDNVTKSGNFSIEEYQFDQPNDALIEQFEQVDFEGVSGRIKFDRETGSVDRFVDIFQVLNGSSEFVGYFNNGMLVKTVDSVEFIDDTFPMELITVHPAAILFCLPILIITVITIVTHVVVVVYRDFKSIRASSPKTNHLAYIGVYFLVIGFAIGTVSYAAELGGREADLCQAIWAFFFPYGFTLAFGAVGVRTWRLYRIFFHYLNPGKFISNPALFTIVFGLLSIDVVMSVVWTSVDPLTLTYTIDRSNSDSPIVRQRCDCDYYFVWFAIIIGFHLLQLVALIVLAAFTRKITTKSFQTVTLQVLTYGTTVVFGLGATLYYFSVFQRLDIHIVYISLGSVITLVALLYLLCVFLPPILPLIKYKLKERGYHANVSARFRKQSQEVFLCT